MGAPLDYLCPGRKRAHICAGTFRRERIFRSSKPAEDVLRGIIGDLRPTVRQARPEEYRGLREIEFEADQLFASVGIGPFNNDDAEDHFDRAVLVLVVGDPPVGFACVDLVDGAPHIWQLSVRPDHGRRGLGRALVEAVCDWARKERFEVVTLTTYRDVPWNGPFYESLGFATLGVLTPGLLAIREHERTIGDDDFGPRVAMNLAL